mmetsp:Transcript_20149/g.52385  ORF Transcript_20149/g.52385 Transcript_20149/m.52385 type:complete len:203 (-) Transcript_20149:48-656(-)
MRPTKGAGPSFASSSKSVWYCRWFSMSVTEGSAMKRGWLWYQPTTSRSLPRITSRTCSSDTGSISTSVAPSSSLGTALQGNGAWTCISLVSGSQRPPSNPIISASHRCACKSQRNATSGCTLSDKGCFSSSSTASAPSTFSPYASQATRAWGSNWCAFRPSMSWATLSEASRLLEGRRRDRGAASCTSRPDAVNSSVKGPSQ